MHIFCYIASNFFELFMQFSLLFETYTYSLTSMLRSSVFPVIEGVSYFAIFYFASKVQQKDTKLRNRVKDIAFRLQLSELNKSYGYIFTEFIYSRRIIIFTACGMFDLSKRVLLASTGILISFNLLILQLTMF